LLIARSAGEPAILEVRKFLMDSNPQCPRTLWLLIYEILPNGTRRSYNQLVKTLTQSSQNN
jgi:hypothetical protein